MKKIHFIMPAAWILFSSAYACDLTLVSIDQPSQKTKAQFGNKECPKDTAMFQNNQWAWGNKPTHGKNTFYGPNGQKISYQYALKNGQCQLGFNTPNGQAKIFNLNLFDKKFSSSNSMCNMMAAEWTSVVYKDGQLWVVMKKPPKSMM